MNRRDVLAALAAAGAGVLRGAARPLNFLIVLTDDLGSPDVGCYGSRKHSTPNIDALAKSGVRFETCYATPLCSPSRVALMTGRYAYRTGWYNFIGRETTRKDHVDPDEITFADVVKPKGYRTCLAGKWQLGLITTQPRMIFDSGFDEYFAWAWKEGGLPKGSGFAGSERQRYWHPAMLENGKFYPTTPEQYGPDLITDWTLNFMRRNRERPFLAYYSSLLTHEPWDPTPVPGHPGQKTKGGLKANLEYLDYSVGRLMQGLKENGLERNTVVMFMGDNGTGQDGKGTVSELGVRVPLIVRCPGVIREGVVSRDLVDFSDVMPTIADLAGAPLPKGVAIDGRSFAPQLRGERGHPRDWIFSYLAYERLLRDRRWLLEGDNRFYDCGESRDGTGYRDVTKSKDPEVLAARARFEKILAKMPAPPKE